LVGSAWTYRQPLPLPTSPTQRIPARVEKSLAPLTAAVFRSPFRGLQNRVVDATAARHRCAPGKESSMRFRRIRTDTGLAYEVEESDGQWQARPGWEPLGPSPFTPAFERDIADEYFSRSHRCLPFQPLSFRDFMLYEEHVVAAGRGMLRRFHPGSLRVVDTYERVTRRTFPMLKPKPLWYREPIYYMSNHVTFVPSGTPMSFPGYSEALDFELELGFVLNRELRDATPQAATDAIGAFVVLNDFSARDVQRPEMESGFGPQASKHFASSLSETAVIAAEILPKVNSLKGSVAINGTTISTVSSAGMKYTLGEVLAHVSRSQTLRAGELFGTGTLPGGSGMETGHWLRPGDRLTMTLDGVGEIEHDIISG
jgi:2-keto-4-pentenoate hydratase/2-oxohepta-3-ene-1,7-dioic acid hydratase in catechol pathway